MTRRRQSIPLNTPETLVVTTTYAICESLRALARTGLYGRTSEDVADRLLAAKVREMMQDGVWLPRPGDLR